MDSPAGMDETTAHLQKTHMAYELWIYTHTYQLYMSNHKHDQCGN